MHTHQRWETTPEALRRYHLDRRYRVNWPYAALVVYVAAVLAVLGWAVYGLAGLI